MSSDRPIIIVGCPRSGTTMLQLMLHAHPRIAIAPENRFVLPAYRRRRTWGDLSRPEQRRALGRWIVDYHRFEDLGLPKETIVERIVDGPPTVGSALGIVLQAYADRFGKPRWGDKRPYYLHNVDIILRLFPDAQIINIMRDGRDCVASLKEAPWLSGVSMHKIVSLWTRAAEESQRLSDRLDPSSYHQVRYEDLVAEPERHLRTLCAFLDEDYDPAMVKPSEQAGVVVPAYKTWHSLTHSNVTTQRVKSWQRRLTPTEISLCEYAFGNHLVANGYQLCGAPKPPISSRARWTATVARHAVAPVKRAAVRTGDRLLPGAPVAAQSSV